MTTLLNLHDEIPDADEKKLADNLRALAFRLVSRHPVAAPLLTVAAGYRIAAPAAAPALSGATAANPAALIALMSPATPPRP